MDIDGHFLIKTGGDKMKRLLFGAIFLALVFTVPTFTMARVDVHVSFPLPPPIVFPAPPEVIVIPETYVYVVPDIDVDLFFWNGWWWRLWEGRWYRSRYYDGSWGCYENVSSFYFDVDPGWRGHYRDHDWYGHRWNYERIPYKGLQQNWKSWQDNRRWEKRGTWGVQGYKPRPVQQRKELKQQWQQQYHQRPEVRQHQEQIQKQQREQVQKPQKQKLQPQQEKQPKVQQPQKQEQPQKQHSQPQGKESQHQQFQGKPEGGDQEHRK